MIVAIIPAFNEEDTIGSVVLGTKKYVDKIIVIDDGSKDKTAEIAQLAGAEVVQHIQNGGKGEALKTGFKIAENLHADIVVCLDSDGQHNPDYIPKVIAPILSGDAEMVIASRFVNKEHVKEVPKYRRFGLWVLNIATNLGSKTKITDSQCGFRAYSGEVLRKFRFQQKGLSIESEMLEDAIDNKIKIKEVPFSPKYDDSNTHSEKPAKHGLRVLKFILKLVKERHPLLFFGVSGAIFLLIGLGFGIYCIDCFFRHDYLPFGPSLTASVLILMGALSLFAGLILNSISGMIKGLRQLNRSQEEKREYKILGQTPLSHKTEEIILGNVNGHKILGLTALNYSPGDTLLGDINGQNTLGLTALNHNPGYTLLGDINGQDTLGLSAVTNNPGGFLLGNINVQKNQGITASGNIGEEMLSEDVDDDKIY